MPDFISERYPQPIQLLGEVGLNTYTELQRNAVFIDAMQQWPMDRTITLLAAAATVAQSWTAERFSERKEFASLLDDLLVAINDTIQVWQDYQETEAAAPVQGSGAQVSDWVGERRWDRLAELNWRMNEAVQRIAELVQLEAGELCDRDQVMLKIAASQFDAEVEDRGAYAARVAIQYLTEYATQIKLLQERLA